MRKIAVRGFQREEGYSLGSIRIEQKGTILDETRNTVFQVLRRLPHWVWQFDDGTNILWDDETTIPIR